MDSSRAQFTTGHDFSDLALKSLLVGLALVLVFVFLAPCLDHHFTERQHNHSHIFLTSSAASHGHPEFHPFERIHFHDAFTDHDSHGDGILYQGSNEGLSESGSVFFANFINDSQSYPIYSNDTFSFAMAGGDGMYQGTTPAPPTRPPRA